MYNKYYFSSKLVYCLYSSGLWSTPSTTGEEPPPISGFSLVKVSESTLVLFGGYNGDDCTDDLYTLDINDMVSTYELPVCTDNTY